MPAASMARLLQDGLQAAAGRLCLHGVTGVQHRAAVPRVTPAHPVGMPSGRARHRLHGIAGSTCCGAPPTRNPGHTAGSRELARCARAAAAARLVPPPRPAADNAALPLRAPIPPHAVGVTYVHERLHAQLYGEGVEPEEILGGRVAVPPELLPLYCDIEERASEARVRSTAIHRCESVNRGHGETGGHSSWCALSSQHRRRPLLSGP